MARTKKGTNPFEKVTWTLPGLLSKSNWMASQLLEDKITIYVNGAFMVDSEGSPVLFNSVRDAQDFVIDFFMSDTLRNMVNDKDLVLKDSDDWGITGARARAWKILNESMTIRLANLRMVKTNPKNVEKYLGPYGPFI